MPDMVTGLSMSKSSISAATRQLIQIGLVERISLPGERRDYYRIKEDVWTKTMKGRGHQITMMRQLAERGLEILQDSSPESRQRLMDMRDLYAFFEREMPMLLDKFFAYRAEQRSDPAQD